MEYPHLEILHFSDTSWTCRKKKKKIIIIVQLGNITFPNYINALKELNELFSKSTKEISALLFYKKTFHVTFCLLVLDWIDWGSSQSIKGKEQYTFYKEPGGLHSSSCTIRFKINTSSICIGPAKQVKCLNYTSLVQFCKVGFM